MVDVTTRAAKGSPLTHAEVDANFTNLKTAVEANETGLADAGGVSVYATIDDLPMSGNSNGDLALVSSTNRLYIFTNSGWYNIALVNQTPTVSGNDASYDLAVDGTPTVVTLSATDPEGIPITWSHVATGLINEATITNVDNVFTITPSTNEADEGDFSVTFRASDGVNIGTATSSFSLVLSPDYENMAFGTSINGGFFAGIIDTTQGNIISNDDYQTGARYALIVSPQQYEGGVSTNAAGLPSGPLSWDLLDRSGQSGSFTRWDGLASTESILAKNDSNYEVFEFIRALRTAYPVPSDGGSDWYVPALDEIELMYRNLKPTADDNKLLGNTHTFPGTVNPGDNPSSSPQGSAYTLTDPAQTSLVDFQIGAAEALNGFTYWSSTDANQDQRAWQFISRSSSAGRRGANVKNATNTTLRPVRRIVF